MLEFTANHLVSHLIGDYLLQSHWMATNKQHAYTPALIHGAMYSIPFWFLTDSSFLALLFIVATHFLVDHYALAKYVVFVKNCLAPELPVWKECKATGYPADVPSWLSVWLLIIADNTIHLILNAVAIQYL